MESSIPKDSVVLRKVHNGHIHVDGRASKLVEGRGGEPIKFVRIKILIRNGKGVHKFEPYNEA